MLFKTKWLDLVYEAAFKGPAFRFVTSPIEALRVLHETISPRYPINISDISIENGKALAETRGRVTLFNGNAILEINPNSIKTTFNNPIGTDDMRIVQDCIELTLEAVGKSLPDVVLDAQTITLRGILELLEEPKKSAQYLRSLHPEMAKAFTSDSERTTEFMPGMKLELLDREFKWAFNFEMSRAWRSDDEIFVLASVRYDSGGKFATLDHKARHFELRLSECLSRIGLVPENVSKN